MLEINPVLAGKFDNMPIQTAVATQSAANISAAKDTTSVENGNATAQTDARRYTQWDRTATEVHTDANMTFGDFLDMINPLQHIPVVSSVYRAVSGDSINPISRIAGDILYGGAFGIASAMLGGVGAIGDSVMEAKTGKDTTGYAMASLFGDDAKPGTISTDKNMMLADATGTATTTNTVATGAAIQAMPATTMPRNAIPGNPTPVAATTTLAAATAASAATNNLLPLNASKAYALNRNKQPFGGVIAPVSNTPPIGASTAIPGNIDMGAATIALNEASHGVRIGNTIYTNRFSAGGRASVAPTTSDAAVPSSTATNSTLATTNTVESSPSLNSTPSAPTSASTAATASADPSHPLPQALLDDLSMLKSLKQYHNTASSDLPGTTIDFSN